MSYFRLALRQLLKRPGFTAVAAFTLALGIGANTTVFSVGKTLLFRDLGVREPERLAWIRPAHTQGGSENELLSWPEYGDIRASAPSFEAVAVLGSNSALLVDGERVAERPSLNVSPSLASVLDIRPVIGRMLEEPDAMRGAPPVALISHEFWQSQFAGNPSALGQKLRFDNVTREIVGVLPPALEFPLFRRSFASTGTPLRPGRHDFWFPQIVSAEDEAARPARMFYIMGRLKAGARMQDAEAELAVLSRRLEADFPDSNRGWTLHAIPYRDTILGQSRQGLQLLAAAVAGVLLICCVNLANLLLARGAAREREMAVRLALGAGRVRLVQAALAECALISLLGGALGIALAHGAVKSIALLAPDGLPFAREIAVDGAAMLFALVLSLGAALLFGLFPALRQSSAAATGALRAGTRSSAGPEVRIWQRGLLAGQIAVVLALLSCAGLLLESFRRLMALDPGYSAGPAINISLNTWNMETNGDNCRFYRQLIARIAALPGVESVGTSSSPPLTAGWVISEKTQAEGQSLPPEEQPAMGLNFVGLDYFQSMGIALLEGRHFRVSEMNDDGPGPVAIVNEAAAALLFPGQSAIGKRFTTRANPDTFYEVVGVVKDTREVRLEEKPIPRFYLHYIFGGAQITIRSAAPASALVPQLRRLIEEAGPRVYRHDIKPMKEIVAASVAERRFLMAMLAAYALVALGIASVGIFGVVACQVAQRTNEFGIRLALGSTPRGLACLVLGQSGRMALAGLSIGLVLSLLAARLISSQVFGLAPHDPMVLGGACALLLAVSLAASFFPARRAACVDPIEALRQE